MYVCRCCYTKLWNYCIGTLNDWWEHSSCHCNSRRQCSILLRNQENSNVSKHVSEHNANICYLSMYTDKDDKKQGLCSAVFFPAFSTSVLVAQLSWRLIVHTWWRVWVLQWVWHWCRLWHCLPLWHWSFQWPFGKVFFFSIELFSDLKHWPWPTHNEHCILIRMLYLFSECASCLLFHIWKKYIVFEECLLSLFNQCQNCGKKLQVWAQEQLELFSHLSALLTMFLQVWLW